MSEGLRKDRFSQNSGIVLDNIISLIRNSLETSKLQDFQIVIDQITERINAEFKNQLGVHLASYRGIATTFFNDMIRALRAANKVCIDRGNDCLSDLGAFLSGELISCLLYTSPSPRDS